MRYLYQTTIIAAINFRSEAQPGRHKHGPRTSNTMATHSKLPLSEKDMASTADAALGDQRCTSNMSSPKTDYAGAQAKTDPAEINLVRKLDWYMMVSLPTDVGFPLTLVAANVVLDVLHELSGPQQPRTGPLEQYRGGSWYEGHRFQHDYLDLVRGLHAHAGSEQHDDHESQASKLVYVALDACLGCSLRLHSLGPELWRTCRLSIHLGYRRSSLLPSGNIHAVQLLYTEGSRSTDSNPVWGPDSCYGLLGLDCCRHICWPRRRYRYRGVAMAVHYRRIYHGVYRTLWLLHPSRRAFDNEMADRSRASTGLRQDEARQDR